VRSKRQTEQRLAIDPSSELKDLASAAKAFAGTP